MLEECRLYDAGTAFAVEDAIRFKLWARRHFYLSPEITDYYRATVEEVRAALDEAEIEVFATSIQVFMFPPTELVRITMSERRAAKLAA